MVPAVSRPFRGRAQGRARGRRIVIHSQGGVSQNDGGGYHTPPFRLPLVLFGLLELHRTARDAPAGRDWTGATPPF